MIGNDNGALYELITLAQAGDTRIQEQLVENNLGLVWSVVRKFQNRGYETDDLYQIGCIGLVKAIKKFDITFGVKFSTYAIPMIIGEIRRFLRDDSVIKVSRSLKDLAYKVRVARETMIIQLDRDPTLSELANALSVTVEEIVVALEATEAPSSLNAHIYDDDTEKIEHFNCGKDEEGSTLNRIMLKQAIGALPARERQIIFLRYFKDLTQTQIAAKLGISQVQVSRIEKKTIAKIREQFVVNG
ncbi:MAG: RNA polymerase sporulation sigma factor, SigF/SigG family [Hyphomonadaceae bacterium]|nr:RNA polymerase sporulation sigma factor, SigF/SigG family [Clostridia bacterium]